MHPSITCVRTLLPEYKYTAAEAMAAYDRWVSGRPESFREKAHRIFEAAAIEEKHTLVPAETIFSRRSLAESNQAYEKGALRLGERLLRETLEEAGWNPESLDLIVTTSCTGHMIPSLDAHLVNSVGLRPDVRRMPITQIGCAGGVAGMIYAYDFLRAYPRSRAAVLSLEFPSNTIQLDNFSWDNIVGTAIFGDGAGCVLMSGEGGRGPVIRDVEMRQVPDTTDLLGYSLTDTGYLMNLDRRIPDVIERHFMDVVESFLKRNEASLATIQQVLVHPGGIKILDKLDALLKAHGHHADASRAIMRRHGNMSSSTIHFILQSYLGGTPHPGRVLVMSYGPGFTAYQMLLEENPS